MGNVFNTCTGSEFRMAANSLTRLQEDQTIVYELEPSQLAVCTSLFDKTGFAESKRAPGLTSKRRPVRASPSLLVGGRLTKKPTALVSARAQRAFCIGWVRGMVAQISNFTCGVSDYNTQCQIAQMSQNINLRNSTGSVMMMTFETHEMANRYAGSTSDIGRSYKPMNRTESHI